MIAINNETSNINSKTSRNLCESKVQLKLRELDLIASLWIFNVENVNLEICQNQTEISNPRTCQKS